MVAVVAIGDGGGSGGGVYTEGDGIDISASNVVSVGLASDSGLSFVHGG